MDASLINFFIAVKYDIHLSYLTAIIIMGDIMRISRLIEITLVLLNKEIVTAKELAERLEVSTRTIYRDIEALSMAGVPVYMSKGNGGGISLLQDYSINKAILSTEDKESLILALKTLQVTKYPEIDSVFEKISAIFNDDNSEDWVQVDFNQWGSNPNENHKFIKIKKSILKRHVITFNYTNALGDTTNRVVEPMKLLYKGNAWYLYGFCRLKSDFRIFRISRIKVLVINSEVFSRRKKENIQSLEYKDEPTKNVTLKLRFKPNALYRIYDDFDEKDIVRNKDNTYDVTVTFPEDEWVYGYILSFGNYVEVLEPKHIKDIIITRMKEALKIYEK